MKCFYNFLVTLLLIQPAFATDYEGLITKYKSKLALIESKSQKKLVIQYKSTKIESQGRNLTVGDFVSFEGTRSSTDSLITIESINYVGLKALIGKWSGDDKFCYQFVNFSEVSVFMRDQSKCDFSKMNPQNSRQLAYTINPTTGGWLALISDDMSSYAAEITFKSPISAALSLYDSDSGDILKRIILKKNN